MLERTFTQKEFLRLQKNHPKRARQAFERGINFHLSPSLSKTVNDVFDKAVDEEGNVSAEGLTGVEIVGIIALALSAFGAGVAVGTLGGGGTTVTVTESGDGDVNVNTNGGGGNGEGNGNGDPGGGNTGGGGDSGGSGGN